MFATHCGEAPPDEPDEIRIGLLFDTGTFAAPPTRQAAELALALVNESGGLEVGDRLLRVKLLVEETGNTPEGASRAAFELINQSQVVALIGSNTSLNAIPAAEIADAAGVPTITASATHPQVTSGKRCSFRVAFTDPQQSRALARFAVEELKTPAVAALYDAANTYSRGLTEVFFRSYEALGGRVVAAETYITGVRDFRPLLERIWQRRPGALLLPNYRHEVELQIRQARSLGIDATLLGGDAWLPPSLVDLPEADGSYATTHWLIDEAQARPEARAFIAAFRAAYGKDPLPPAANGFDAAELLLRAIRDGDSADPASICRQLSQLEGHPGVTGPLTFRGGDGDPQKPVLITAIRQGRLVLQSLVSP